MSEEHNRRRWLVPLLFLMVLAALWPLRHELTAEAIARRSPRQTVLAAAFLLGLYVLKSLTMCVPMSALTAAGGMLFSLPAALAVNLCGAAAAQTAPFLLGRRRRQDLDTLRRKHPKAAELCRLEPGERWTSVFLLRLGGASPGDLVSLLLGAAGVPYGTYLSAGVLGAAPRVAAATVLGAALWSPGSPRFWLSLGVGGVLAVLSAAIWYLRRKTPTSS